MAVISDIHGNLPALEAVLQDAISHGCKEFISLGDVVGYYAQPGECIDLLREYNALNILGNHDGYLTLGTTCERSKTVAAMIEYHRSIVTESQLKWLRDSVPFHRDGTWLYHHGGPEDPRDQYLYTVSEKTIPDDVKYLFAGHTHVQAKIQFGEKVFCNPGAVGQPRDGDSRAAYASIEDGIISLHRVEYDIDRTAAMMKSAGFESYCYENLYAGTQIGGRIDKIEKTRYMNTL